MNWDLSAPAALITSLVLMIAHKVSIAGLSNAADKPIVSVPAGIATAMTTMKVGVDLQGRKHPYPLSSR